MAKLPPLNPLHVFEVAARLESFSKAALELGVTQSAIGRQIAILESYLGVPLFRRETHGVTLTDVARDYGRDISAAFQQVRTATDKVFNVVQDEPLTIRVYPTFATKWLLPRWATFEARHPDIAIRLTLGYSPVNFAQDDVDAAILLGDAEWPAQYAANPIVPDIITPVCSPALLKAGKIRKVGDLANHRLLHSRFRATAWAEWLTHVGQPEIKGSAETEFPNSALTYQAAIEGLGVAMGQPHLLAQDIRSGLLVCPLEQRFTRPQSYCFVRPQWRSMSPKMRAFRSWILKTAQEDGGA